MYNVLTLVIMFFLITSCFSSNIGCEGSREKTKRKLRENIVSLYERFEKELGYGRVDYDNQTGHVAKSYAALLSTMIRLNQAFGEERHLKNINKIVDWLVDNVLTNNDAKGWGGPVAWDAYADGTVNPADTIYTIGSSLVLESLMDYIDSGLSYRTAEILNLINEVMESFTKERFRTSENLIAYSFHKNDIGYNTFNPAAHIMGQMQRWMKMDNQGIDLSIKDKVKSVADDIALGLLRHVKEDKEQIYWNYSVERSPPNDLCHHLYIANGIYNYIQFDGSYSKKFNFEKIKKHLDSFKRDGNKRTFHPVFFGTNLNARLYGLGYLLSNLNLQSSNLNDGDDLVNYIENNYKISKASYSRWENEKIDINEYNAYLFKGLVYFYLSSLSLFYK